MSLDFFRKNIEQLFFSEGLTRDNIQRHFKMYPKKKYYTLGKIYGVDLKKDICKYSKYTFVKKEYATQFFAENINDNEHLKQYKDELIKRVGDDATDHSSFVYLITACDAIDPRFCREQFRKELSTVINTLRYMSGLKQKRIYIDQIKNYGSYTTYEQYTDEGVVGSEFQLDIKDIPITIDADHFCSKENGNARIWEILA